MFSIKKPLTHANSPGTSSNRPPHHFPFVYFLHSLSHFYFKWFSASHLFCVFGLMKYFFSLPSFPHWEYNSLCSVLHNLIYVNFFLLSLSFLCTFSLEPLRYLWMSSKCSCSCWILIFYGAYVDVVSHMAKKIHRDWSRKRQKWQK